MQYLSLLYMKQVLRNSIDHRDIHNGLEKVFDIRSHTWAASWSQ